MGRNKVENHQVRKLNRIGNKEYASYYVTIPVELVRGFGWRDKQKLVVRQQGNSKKIVIEDWSD